MSKIPNARSTRSPAYDGMVHIAGGNFRMGSGSHYAEEAPVRGEKVDSFWMDIGPVTNLMFARFTAETFYVTQAEQGPNPGALVFRMTDGPVDTGDAGQWWSFVPGAYWRKPEGRGSDLFGRERHPVVHVTYEDALAYAKWAGKQLPGEAEWEFAARGGLDGAEFAWGDALEPNGRQLANIWQGSFPWQNLALDGWSSTSPVGFYPANGYGLFDMSGNVWEWTQDLFSASIPPQTNAKACHVSHNPRHAADRPDALSAPLIHVVRHVVKGGSHLCAPDYCARYRPAARQAQTIDIAMSHLGFRCIRRKTSDR